MVRLPRTQAQPQPPCSLHQDLARARSSRPMGSPDLSMQQLSPNEHSRRLRGALGLYLLMLAPMLLACAYLLRLLTGMQQAHQPPTQLLRPPCSALTGPQVSQGQSRSFMLSRQSLLQPVQAPGLPAACLLQRAQSGCCSVVPLR